MLLLHAAADIGERQKDDREARRSGFFCGRDYRGIRMDGVGDLKRKDTDRLGDVLELRRTEVGDSKIEPSLDLTVSILGETNRARLANAFQPRGDVDTVAHQIAIGLLDDVAQMNADPEFYAAL